MPKWLVNSDIRDRVQELAKRAPAAIGCVVGKFCASEKTVFLIPMWEGFLASGRPSQRKKVAQCRVRRRGLVDYQDMPDILLVELKGSSSGSLADFGV